jgi:hypothetical protein
MESECLVDDQIPSEIGEARHLVPILTNTSSSGSKAEDNQILPEDITEQVVEKFDLTSNPEPFVGTNVKKWLEYFSFSRSFSKCIYDDLEIHSMSDLAFAYQDNVILDSIESRSKLMDFRKFITMAKSFTPCLRKGSQAISVVRETISPNLWECKSPMEASILSTETLVDEDGLSPQDTDLIVTKEEHSASHDEESLSETVSTLSTSFAKGSQEKHDKFDVNTNTAKTQMESKKLETDCMSNFVLEIALEPVSVERRQRVMTTIDLTDDAVSTNDQELGLSEQPSHSSVTQRKRSLSLAPTSTLLSERKKRPMLSETKACPLCGCKANPTYSRRCRQCLSSLVDTNIFRPKEPYKPKEGRFKHHSAEPLASSLLSYQSNSSKNALWIRKRPR